jgi:hypothetical protein
VSDETVYEQALRYAKAAYDAYRTYRPLEVRLGLETDTSELLPLWDQLSAQRQQAWFAVVEHVEELVLREQWHTSES